MKKEAQTEFMHRIGLRKRQTLSDEASEPLPQGVVPSFDMSSQARLFSRRRVLPGRDDYLVCLPEVAETVPTAINDRDALPEFLASCPAAVADHISDYLTSRTTQGDPNPPFVGAFQDK